MAPFRNLIAAMLVTAYATESDFLEGVLAADDACIAGDVTYCAVALLQHGSRRPLLGSELLPALESLEEVANPFTASEARHSRTEVGASLVESAAADMEILARMKVSMGQGSEGDALSITYALEHCYPTSRHFAVKYTCNEQGEFAQLAFPSANCAGETLSILGGGSPWSVFPGGVVWTCKSGAEACSNLWQAEAASSCVEGAQHLSTSLLEIESSVVTA